MDRSLVAMPAWRDLGWVAWAAFSRHADLGHGLVVYPVMAIGGTFATVAAAILFVRSGRSPRGAATPLFIAAALALISLPLSFEAAPYMLKLRHIDSGDLAALGQAFSGFEFWGRLQGLCHLASFGALVWALVALGRPAERSPTERHQAESTGNCDWQHTDEHLLGAATARTRGGKSDHAQRNGF